MGFYIDMIAIGEGDSFLLTLDGGENGEGYVLIDAGPAKSSSILVVHLKLITKGRIDLLIGTHLDSDHIGGLEEVVKNFSIGKIILNVPGNMDKWIQARETLLEYGKKVVSLKKMVENISVADGLLKKVKEKGITIEGATRGRKWTHGTDIELAVLNPTPERLALAWADEVLQESTSYAILFEKAEAPATSPSNDSSIVLELIYKKNPYALFTGDAGADVIREVTDTKTYTLLKVPHHGSKTGLDEELVKQIKPETAYIPVGENPHGHPAIEILDMLQAVGAKTFCAEKTKDCRKDCKEGGFGNLCHKKDKDSRQGWSSVNSEDCKNNKKG